MLLSITVFLLEIEVTKKLAIRMKQVAMRMKEYTFPMKIWMICKLQVSTLNYFITDLLLRIDIFLDQCVFSLYS